MSMKKPLFLILVLILTLLLSLGMYVAVSAESAKNDAMQLHLVEGSVTVSDSDGADRAIRRDMSISSGDRVTTGDDGSASVSLDGSKKIVLDRNTSVTFKKDGRRFEIRLLAGQLFFQTTAPLSEDEALEIYTDSFMTSVRGSSGIVSLRKIIYGTGHGVGQRLDGSGNLAQAFGMRGGQIFVLTGDGTEAKLEEAQISDFPSVYLKEVERDEQLQQSLSNEGNYSVDELIAEIPAAEQREEKQREDNKPYNPIPAEEPTFTITWIVEGSQPITTSVKRGQIPEYPGGNPVREEDSRYFYTFDHWEPRPIAADENASYTAVFTETRKTYFIYFVDEDGTELQRSKLPYGETPVYSGVVPTKPATAQYIYTFVGWTPDIADVTEAATYKAIYESTLTKYTVTFMDDDGLTELSSKEYDYGTPAADIERPDDPEKTDETGQYSYTFTGWDSEIASVFGDAIYTATYEITLNKFTVTFMDDDGLTELSSKEYDYGTPAADIERPADPEKTDETGQYSYTFTGWDSEIEDVTGDATYTATYERTLNKYTVTFMNGLTELSSKEYDYGTPASDIERPADPEKTDETGQYSYTFKGWDREIKDVTGNATYTATYERTLNKYTVTFMDDDGLTELSSKEYDYGTPAMDIERPADPEKTDETGQYSYTFTGWDSDIEDVTGNATYTAVYDSTLNKYTVTFMNGLTELSSKEYDYGTPAMDIERPADPEKTDETGKYSYTFKGWDKEIEDVTGNATYTATYDETINKYTVTVAVPQDMIIYVSTDEDSHEFTGPQSYTVNLSYGTEVSIGFEFVPGGTWTDFDYDYAEITVDGEPLDPGENSVVVTHNTTVTIEIETPLIIEG